MILISDFLRLNYIKVELSYGENIFKVDFENDNPIKILYHKL